MILKFKAYISLIRPLNVLISFLSVWTAVFISGNKIPILIWIITGTTAAFLIASANVINDLFDIETDRINKPDRPLASGTVSKPEGILFSSILLIIALSPNFYLPLPALIIILIALFFVVIYTPFLKALPFWGNFIVSLVTASGFLYGASAAGNISSGFFPFMIAFLIHLLREIIKDMEDKLGDSIRSMRTLAIILPAKSIHKIILFLLLIIILLLPLPYILQIYNFYYLLIIFLLIEPALVYLFMLFSKTRQYEKQLYSRASRILKIMMIIGVLSFIISTF